LPCHPMIIVPVLAHSGRCTCAPWRANACQRWPRKIRLKLW
jgi:hypothetical protein